MAYDRKITDDHGVTPGRAPRARYEMALDPPLARGAAEIVISL